MATTISISEEMKENLKNLGRAGESYEEVIRKLYKIARKQLLANYLYDREDCYTIDEAKKELKKWRK